MARVLLDDAACTGCGRCVTICPVDVLRMHGQPARAWVAYADDCSGCRLCEEECPADCIIIDDARNADGTSSIYDLLGIEDVGPPPT